jgi:hypothetical protein
MTRGHFQYIADAVRAATPLARDGQPAMHQWELTVYELATRLAATNGRFRRDRFLRACGVEP